MKTYAVVIPAYNESRTIADVARHALAQTAQVIVVDDGSEDDTVGQLQTLPVILLRHDSNQGKAASLWTGMQHALTLGVDAVITLDGDGQHRPEDIPRLLQAAQQENRIIIAARLQGREQVPRARRFGHRMADFWIAWAAGYPLRDTQSGFRLYPADLLRRIKLPHSRAYSFVFESEILIEAARLGYFAQAVPIQAIYPPQARTSHYRPWADTSRIVRMVAWKLLARGLYIPGLLRSLGVLPAPSGQTSK